MHSSNKHIISILCIALSAFCAYSLISVRSFHFPSAGLAVIFLLLSCIVFLLKKHKILYDRILLAICVFLSVCLVFRSEEFLTLVNIVAILYFGSLLIMESKDRESVPLYQLMFIPAVYFFRFLSGKNEFNVNVKDYSRSVSAKRVQDWGISLVITAVIFMIIIPLLASANPIFKKLIEDIAKSLNVFTFFSTFFGPLFIAHFFRIIVFIFLMIWLPRLFTSLVHSVRDHRSALNINIPLMIPKILTGLLLIVFFVTQIQLYFSSAETLKAMGMMNREYAREVFGQLSIVSFIIFVLLYNDRGTSKWNRITSYILIAEIIFLNAIALKSVYDYTIRFGFTHKRLWGYTGVTWLFGSTVLYLYSYRKILRRDEFIRNSIIFTGLVLIGVNLINFDYLIFHVSRSRTGEGVDHYYLSRNISADAVGYKQHLDELMKILQKSPITYKDTDAAYSVIQRISSLQTKYSAKNFDWRFFNMSEYMTFKKIEGINTEEYNAIVSKRYELLQKTGK